MNLLDEFRDRSGAGAAIRPSSNGGAALRDVLAAAGAPTATLSSRTRRMLWLALATLPIVAVAHPFLLALMSGTGNGSDPFSFAAGLLAWPGALVQPVLVAAAALAVIALAFVTRGFRAASRTPIRAATTPSWSAQRPVCRSCWSCSRSWSSPPSPWPWSRSWCGS